MAIRKYRKKMNGGNVLNKFKQGAFDVQDGANKLNEKRKQHMAEAELHAQAAKDSYHSTLRSGAMGGTVPSPPVMNNLAIPPAMPPSPPQLGGKRRRKRRTRRRRKHGGEQTIDWTKTKFDYDSWADKQAAHDFGGVFNRGRGRTITVQPARRRSKPKHHGKPYAKLTKDEDGEEIVTMGGRRKTRRRSRKHKRKRRKTRRRRKHKRTRRRRR